KVGDSVIPVAASFCVPDSWTWARLRSICLPQTSLEPSGELFRYIDIDSVDNTHLLIREPKLIETKEAPSRARRVVSEGSVLFSMVRPYLKNIALAGKEHDGCIASTGFYVCTPSSSLIRPDWLFLCMQSDYFVLEINRHVRGDNSPSVRKDDMDRMLVPIPPIAEQNRIAGKTAGLVRLLQPY
ncbi:MAG: restriction endonuclease subunit S, partial [Eggerthellaceae bacterium]|nr:restriction endonuclease subunit S [Eggerthellaceae bacterium]